MFDFDLQLRFWRSATDAAMEWSQASMAAATEWQSQALAPSRQPAVSGAASPFNMFNASAPSNPWGWAFSFWQPQLQSPNTWPAASTPFANPAMTFWNPFLNPWGGASPATTWPTMMPGTMPAMMDAFMAWRVLPWSFYQTPLTAMMLSAGLPYTVAGPTARASTATMDAAEAAHQQMLNVFSAYRSDGGHGTSQSFWP